MRHGSLQMNVIYGITKFQSQGCDGKIVILIQKIKVEKWVFNLYLRENKYNHIGIYIA